MAEGKINGQTLVSLTLKSQGLMHVFGIVGVPVLNLGYQLIDDGINYYGMRNEQAAGYAAGVFGYMTGRPGVCLTVPGPGMLNVMSGLGNALVNKWPMLLLSGSADTNLEGAGSFQECHQVDAARKFTKYAARPSDPTQIPYILEQAIRTSIYGTPGPVYVDLPGDLLTAKVSASDVYYPPPIERLPPVEPRLAQVHSAYALLKSAKKPLVIIGKGCCMSQHLLKDDAKGLTEFVTNANLPFLPTPMGKGVVSDFHSNNASAARSLVLREADVVLLLGARLNWILHFGMPPRFNRKVQIIQVETDQHEFHTNRKSACTIFGDIGRVVEELKCLNSKEGWKYENADWWGKINKKKEVNALATKEFIEQPAALLNYYSSISIVQKCLPKNSIIVSEGSNTMDIGRTILMNELPKHRLDAATYANMGIGLASSLAAKVARPDKRVVLVTGDSAFGFSAMEIETAMRYKLPFVIVIINNNGIFQGVEELEKDRTPLDVPPTALLPNANYEKIAHAFGAQGYLVKEKEALEKTLNSVFQKDVSDLSFQEMAVVNVLIDPMAMKKPQEASWLTAKAKL